MSRSFRHSLLHTQLTKLEQYKAFFATLRWSSEGENLMIDCLKVTISVSGGKRVAGTFSTVAQLFCVDNALTDFKTWHFPFLLHLSPQLTSSYQIQKGKILFYLTFFFSATKEKEKVTITLFLKQPFYLPHGASAVASRKKGKLLVTRLKKVFRERANFLRVERKKIWRTFSCPKNTPWPP